mgnify:CR=1 FL=1
MWQAWCAERTLHILNRQSSVRSQFDKTGKRRIDVRTIMYLYFTVCAQRGHRKCHGNAVVAMAVDSAAVDCTAVDDHAIGCGLGRDTQRTQTIGHHLDTVAFLDAQLGSTAQHRAPLGTGGGNENYREFIDRQRHQLRRNLDPRKTRVLYMQVGNRFTADIPLVIDLDACTLSLIHI